MILTEREKNHFFRLFHSLLMYVNKRHGDIEGLKEPDDLFHLSMKELADLRRHLYEDPEVIDLYVSENPHGFGKDDLEVIKKFNHYIGGSFVVVKHLKKYSVLISQDDSEKAFGVLGMNNSFKDILGPDLPVALDIVLVPYKDKIVYDGLMQPYRISFGGSFKKSFNSTYQRIKAKSGIITSLPFDEGENETDDLEMLKMYMKSKYNRDLYWQEIEELKDKDRELLVYYHHKMGKIHSREFKKELKGIGINKGWFGILEGMIIGSGAEKKELMNNIQGIVPSDRIDLVHMFEIRSK